MSDQVTEKTWQELHDELALQLAAAQAENERLRAEVVRQAHLIIEQGAKLHIAKGLSAEQFERNELGGKTLNEFLAAPSSKG